MKQRETKEGMKVYYQPSHYVDKNEHENGIIKTIHWNFLKKGKIGYHSVFVVYNCNEDWEHYYNYTAALTHIDYLKVGWK